MPVVKRPLKPHLRKQARERLYPSSTVASSSSGTTASESFAVQGYEATLVRGGRVEDDVEGLEEWEGKKEIGMGEVVVDR